MVNSTAIRNLGYDPDDQRLTISFTDQRSYSYQGVSAKTVVDLLSAPSVGRFFNQNIRNQYQASRA